MITKTVKDLNQTNQATHKIDKVTERKVFCAAREENKLQKQVTISAYELLTLEQEAEICREQLKTLKQELEYERQRAEEYYQELLYANSEIETLNRELLGEFSVKRVKLAQAKQLARNILSSRQFTSNSLAELLSAIYDVKVTADELEPITNRDDKAFVKRAG